MTPVDRYLYTQGDIDTFDQRNASFMEKLPRLVSLLDAIAGRRLLTPDTASKVVAGLALITVRSFRDILLTARHGSGVAALQLLRGMYERTLTLLYIDANIDKAQDFLDYGAIQLHKHAVLMREKLGPAAASDERIADLATARAEVEPKFKRPKCDRSGCRPTLFHSWTPVTPHQMAESVGLDRQLPSAYSQPTLEAHATIVSILSRATDLPDGIGIVMSGGQDFDADVAVNIAHQLVLRVAQMMTTRFSLTDLQPAVDTCVQDLQDIGPIPGPAAETSEQAPSPGIPVGDDPGSLP